MESYYETMFTNSTSFWDIEYSNLWLLQFGFGFDSIANNFKIMRVKRKEQQPLIGHIYSCNSDCWSEITPSSFPYPGIPNSLRPFIFKRSPYWLIPQTRCREERFTVISFDVREEAFRLLPDLVSLEKNLTESTIYWILWILLLSCSMVRHYSSG